MNRATRRIFTRPLPRVRVIDRTRGSQVPLSIRKSKRRAAAKVARQSRKANR